MRPLEILPAPADGLYVPGETGLYVRPLDLVHRPATTAPGDADRLLGGGPYRFQNIEILLRTPERIVAFCGSVQQMRDWAVRNGCLEAVDDGILRLTQRREPLLGRNWDRPLLMGIVNVTPDSFSESVSRRDPAAAISHAHSLIEAGADILDIGGESTRPGSGSVSEAEEIDRVVPVIGKVAGFGVPVSVDTSKAAVMTAALEAGASIINDVTALEGDPESPAVASKARVPLILMHMQGRPRTMQNEPWYDCAPLDVHDFLSSRVDACERLGIRRNTLIIDPGIGFGKNDQHNLGILARIGLMHSIGVPVMVGVSRKSLVGRLSGGDDPEQRLGGSLALGLGAIAQGVQILRVHDVAETRQALALRHAVLDVL